MDTNTDNSAFWASMLNNGNQWINNPWIYFVFLALFGRNGGLYGGNNDCGGKCGGAAAALAHDALAQTIADNHNADLTMGAIKANAEAARDLAGQLNVGVDSVNAAINSFRNAADLGFMGMQSAFKECCCENQKETMKMGYENQLASQKQGYDNIISNLQQTNSLMSRIDQLANGITQGFSATAYATQAQTCELKTNQNENTQRIIDTMNAHWQEDLSQRLSDAKLEMSQLKQNATLIAALRA